MEESSEDESSISDERLSSDEEKIVSFRGSEYTQSHYHDEEGDIGLGSQSNSAHLHQSEESNLWTKI